MQNVIFLTECRENERFISNFSTLFRKYITALLGNDGDEAIVDENPVSRDQHFRDVLIIDPEHVFGALLFESIVRDDFDSGTFFQSEFQATVISFQNASSDLRALGV